MGVLDTRQLGRRLGGGETQAPPGGAGEVWWWASICIGGPIRQLATGRIAPPQTQYIYLEVEYIYISKRNIYLEVNTTSNMVHQLTDIYIPHTHADSPPNHRG